MSDLTDVFVVGDQEALEDYGGDVSGKNFRKSTASSVLSSSTMLTSSTSEDAASHNFLPPPPPPKGEPIHSSSLMVQETEKHVTTEDPRNQRHSLPADAYMGENRSFSPSLPHQQPLSPSPIPKRESLSSSAEMDYFAENFASSVKFEEDSPNNFPSRPTTATRRMTTDGGIVDFKQIPRPPTIRAGERSVSTTVRLRRQGFRMSRSGRTGFAVKSIRRGSDEWNHLIKPFVADLAFRSLEIRRYQSEVSYRPYTCQAAVLFIDLSDYSGITAAIADRGAHALSSVVNSYFGRILDIARSYGGDAIKFAGDAVIIVWEGQQDDLQINCWAAAKCAMEIQQRAGVHEIEGTDLAFRLHCGLCCGQLESEIFAAPVHVHMQRLYHSVGGESLVEISELVDAAAAGETCISESCFRYLGERATYKNKTIASPDGPLSYKLLTGLELDTVESEYLDSFLENAMSERMFRRNKRIEEEFIHPSVLSLLIHGGLSPTQIAQMRNLCVLFIAMTSNGSSVNWLMEVQAILDKNRCPIVQIISDDKGVHLVAAVNLYEAIPETSLKGVEVCCELVSKQVGCAIGVAQGPTFCGVTGCSTVACRWDITGPPAVRAARLMQYALLSGLEAAVDQSVADDPVAGTRLALYESGVGLKGCDIPVSIYTISTAKKVAALRVLETVHGRCHDGMVEKIKTHILEGRKRCAVLVTGISLAGKKIVCQRAAGAANLVPYLHVSDDSAGFLQLARTIATWFHYIDNDDVRYLADSVLNHLEHGRWSRAHDECIELVNTSLEKGFRSCFLVDRVQFLDDFSISLIRECLHGRARIRRISSQYSDNGVSDVDSSERSLAVRENVPGRICFLLVHVSLYNWKSAPNIVADITRSHRSLHIPIFTLGEARREELRVLMRDLADVEAEDRWLDAMAEASGFCAGYFIERVAGMRKLSTKRWKDGQQGYTQLTTDLKMYISPGLVKAAKQIPVRQISADVAMRFSQVFDGLPPLFQTFAKVLSLSSRTGFFQLPRVIMWETLNDLVATGVETGVLDIVIKEMTEMSLIKVEHEDGEEKLAFRSPAMGDVAFEVCTPVQIESIGHALIDRLAPILGTSFKIPFALANLYNLLGEDKEQQKELWVEGYTAFLRESVDWDKRTKDKWEEAIDDELRAASYDSKKILGNDFCFSCVSKPVMSDFVSLFRGYWPPLALGPMSHTFSVILRNTFHEIGAFHGYPEERVRASRKDMESASKRYLQEMEVVETFLSEHGFEADIEILQQEREMIKEIATPASADEEVLRKAEKILEEFVPKFIEGRLNRLHGLVEKFRDGDIPAVVERGDEALRHAYGVMRGALCRSDAAQDALMVLATHNWKPQPVPEYLNLLSYQTVARIRNKVLKRLTKTELFLFKHQQTEIDLEAFLVVTPLLQEAHKQQKC